MYNHQRVFNWKNITNSSNMNTGPKPLMSCRPVYSGPLPTPHSALEETTKHKSNPAPTTRLYPEKPIWIKRHIHQTINLKGQEESKIKMEKVTTPRKLHKLIRPAHRIQCHPQPRQTAFLSLPIHQRPIMLLPPGALLSLHHLLM